jgi:hypothetical protein
MNPFDTLNPINITEISNPIDLTILEHIEKEIEENSLIRALDSEKHVVSVAIEKNKNTYNILSLTPGLTLSEKDKTLLMTWLNIPKHYYYMDEMFRIDLENYIFLIKIYTDSFNKNNILLHGFAVKNNLDSKLGLLQQRQRYSMSTYMS